MENHGNILKNSTPTELALRTWYKPDNPLYHNPEHPTIKLAGEIGELLDLYGKHKYKPNFSWLDCKECGFSAEEHSDYENMCGGFYPSSLVLDELGDIWYYLRILAWMWNKELELIPISDKDDTETIEAIKTMYIGAAIILEIGKANFSIKVIYTYLVLILDSLNTTIEELTLLNYYKLNSDETNHGWKDAQ